MTPLLLLISFGLIWVNLVGLALLCDRLVRDYPVSRLASLLGFCLLFFFIEHFHGFGPRLVFMPFSSAVSAWLIWRDRSVLRSNWVFEAVFGTGLLYCLVWRYTFPDIDLFEERIPDLAFINDYIAGTVLPPPDRWMPPFKADFYYSFQFYSSALLGRWFGFEPAICYQVSYCLISGLIASAVYCAARRLSSWRASGWVITSALMLGGCGLAVVIHLSMKSYLQPLEMVRYLGMVWAPEYRTAFGRLLDSMMYTPGKNPVELPVEPLSYIIAKGEFHPPLTGFLVLVFSLLLLATLDGERSPRQRRILHALLGATVPLSLIGNTWVFPLQSALVVGWVAYRLLARDRESLLPVVVGAGVATALCYPFLVGFMQQPTAHSTALRLTRAGDHATPVEWLTVFWPLVGLMGLSLLNRERRGLSGFFCCLWLVLLAATELFYNHDVNGGTWERFNSTLKWWGWIYAGGVLTLGALNLGSRSRLARYGSLVVILLPCVQAYDYGRQFAETPKPSLGKIDGTYWITSDYTIRDIISSLKTRPDGICIDSNLTHANTDATIVAVFANKQCLLGWPVQEGIWRENRMDVNTRLADITKFYQGKMDDPLSWLIKNDVRYILWMQKDNDHLNERFLPLKEKIKSRYAWEQYAGTGTDWAVGYFERIDGLAPVK